MEVTKIGLGTYLGAATDAVNEQYISAAREYLALGGNAFDTAANYRGGRSELALGRVFRDLPRESFFVSTKAGYLPMGDGATPESPRVWFQRVLSGPGILASDEVVDGCHAMTPRYLAHQAGVSLAALGVARLDVLHLHNPEHQLPALGREAFRTAIRNAFGACEELVARGQVGAYGCATWNGLRGPPGPRTI